MSKVNDGIEDRLLIARGRVSREQALLLQVLALGEREAAAGRMKPVRAVADRLRNRRAKGR